jgi:FkbM family methyltransferase
MSLRGVLSKLTANNPIQRCLEVNVFISQYLMGIGSGSGVSSSGERAIFEVLKGRLKPPYCIFDVGANQGQFLRLTLNALEREDFSIHCFEPGHGTYKSLVDNSKVESWIRLNNLGIGKAKGEAALHSDGVGSGLASLTKRKLDHFNIDFDRSETVEITTIDDYCSENAIDHIHLLKIDIEGHELDALIGAKQMLEAKSIDVVTFEFGGCNIDTRTFFQDFWYLFTNLNMRIFRITPSGYLSLIKSYKEAHEQFRTTNFIALLDGL